MRKAIFGKCCLAGLILVHGAFGEAKPRLRRPSQARLNGGPEHKRSAVAAKELSVNRTAQGGADALAPNVSAFREPSVAVATPSRNGQAESPGAAPVQRSIEGPARGIPQRAGAPEAAAEHRASQRPVDSAAASAASGPQVPRPDDVTRSKAERK